MQLQIGTDIGRAEQLFLTADGVHVRTACGQRITQRHFVTTALERQICRRELAPQRTRAHIGLAKPGAFFPTKANHLQRCSQRDAFTPGRQQHQQTGNHTSQAVVITALWHRVQVRAAPDRRGAACVSRVEIDEVASAVRGHIQTFAAHKFFQIGSAGVLALAVTGAGDTHTIKSQRTNVSKQLLGQWL